MLKKSEIFWLLFFFIAGLLLRLNNLSERSLWTDEFHTYFHASGNGISIANFIAGIASAPKPVLLKAGEAKVFLKSNPDKTIKDVTAGILRNDTHPPFYFWIMYYWLRWFGNGIFSVRFFSVLLGMLTIPLAYALSNRIFNQGAAIFTAIFTSISAFCVRYSQEARSYSLVMFLALLSCLLILKLQKDNRNSDAFWLSVVNALGILTHYFYILIIIPQFIYFTVRHHKNSAALDKFYLAFLVSLLLLSPWYMLVAINGYKFYLAEWAFGHPGFSDKIYAVLLGVGRYIILPEAYRATWTHLFLLAGAVLLAYLIFTALKSIIRGYRRSLLFCLMMFFLPLVGMFLIDIIQHGALLRQERFWVFALVGLIPIIGYSLHYHFLKNRLFVSGVILAMLVFSIIASGVIFGPAPKEASLWINQESISSKTAVIVYNARSTVFPQAYYLDDDITLIPVSTFQQFSSAIQAAASYADKIFIARHYYRTGPSLFNPDFMESSVIASGLVFQASFYRDDLSVAEYLNAYHKRPL